MYFMQLDLEVFFIQDNETVTYSRPVIFFFFYKSAISGRCRADIDVLKGKNKLF